MRIEKSFLISIVILFLGRKFSFKKDIFWILIKKIFPPFAYSSVLSWKFFDAYFKKIFKNQVVEELEFFCKQTVGFLHT